MLVGFWPNRVGRLRLFTFVRKELFRQTARKKIAAAQRARWARVKARIIEVKILLLFYTKVGFHGLGLYSGDCAPDAAYEGSDARGSAVRRKRAIPLPSTPEDFLLSSSQADR